MAVLDLWLTDEELEETNTRYADVLRKRRNAEQQNRLAKRRYDAELWSKAKLLILKSTPCHCGRDHHPLKAISQDGETEIFCPVTFWGFLTIHGQEPNYTFEEMMERVNVNRNGGPAQDTGIA